MRLLGCMLIICRTILESRKKVFGVNQVTDKIHHNSPAVATEPSGHAVNNGDGDD